MIRNGCPFSATGQVSFPSTVPGLIRHDWRAVSCRGSAGAPQNVTWLARKPRVWETLLTLATTP